MRKGRNLKDGGSIFLLTIGLICNILSSANAVDVSKKFGIGLGYPYFSARYGFNDKFTGEVRGASGSGIEVFSGRGYYNFYSDKEVLGFCGAEAGVINFDTEDTPGAGTIGMLFFGGEYFVNQNLSCQFDIGPAYININTEEIGQEFTAEGIEWIFNLGLNLYFGLPVVEEQVTQTKPRKSYGKERGYRKLSSVEKKVLAEKQFGETALPVKSLSPEEKKQQMRKSFVKGQEEFEKENYSQAIDKFQEVVKLEPEHQLSKSNIKRAKKKIVDRDRNTINKYLRSAKQSLQSDNYQGAKRTYIKGIKEFPHLEIFYDKLGGLYQQQNQLGLTVDAYLACVEKNPDAVDICKKLAIAYEEMEMEAKFSFGKYSKKAEKYWIRLLGTKYDELAIGRLIILSGGENE